MEALANDILAAKGFFEFRHGKRDESGYDPGYTHQLRISDNIWLLYDKNGFMTLKQPSINGDGSPKKGPAGGSAIAYITLPKPVRTKADLDLLLSAIILTI